MASEKAHLLAHSTDEDRPGPSHIAPPASGDRRPSDITQGPGVPPPRGPDEAQATRSIPPVPAHRLKSLGNAYVIWFPLGLLGLHHFYLKNIAIGFNYLMTFGLFGFGWLVDFWRLPMLVKAANAEIEAKWIWEHEVCELQSQDPVPKFKFEQPKRLSDCYLLGFTTGFLGFHHHYLGRHGWGLLYMFTIGLLGVGFLSDWIRMPLHLKRYNERKAKEREGIDEPKKYYLDDAYVLAFPGGLLGFHNFYLGRYLWGLIYMLTLGVLGFGWLVDLIRMPFLVEDANLRAKSKLSPLDNSVEQGIKYRSTEINGGAPQIDPYYSDYNSGQSQHSYSQSETAPSAPILPEDTQQLQHFREFQVPPADRQHAYTPHPGGIPEPPPPYAPPAGLGSAYPNSEAQVLGEKGDGQLR